MNDLYFDWDENKNLANVKKHNITFELAKSVFYDDMGILIHDPDHSIDEDRFILLGMSEDANILVVCHCFREHNVIRIISARKATKNEDKQYKNQEGW